jgi:hypothetical protein
MNNIIYDKILLINYDENHELIRDDNTINAINSFGDKIISKSPYLIIITTQNSLSRTDKHFQHILGEKLKMRGYRVFSKIDATRPRNSSSISNIFSLKSKPYNVRTRIYYDPKKVIFIDEKLMLLNSKSYFIDKDKYTNRYNSNNLRDKHDFEKNNDKILITNYDKILITNYKVRRYTNINSGKEGTGKIIFILMFKSEGEEYKLIISNNCNYNENKYNPNNPNNAKNISNIQDNKIRIIYNTVPSKIHKLDNNEIMTIQLNNLKQNILKDNINTIIDNTNIIYHRNIIISKIKTLPDIISKYIEQYYTSISENLIIRHMTLFKIISSFPNFNETILPLKNNSKKLVNYLESNTSIFLNSLYRDKISEVNIPFKSILIAIESNISKGGFATAYLTLYNDQLNKINYILRLVRNKKNSTYGILKNKNKILNIKDTLIKSQEMEIIGLLFNIGIQIKYKSVPEKIRYIPYIYEFGIYNDNKEQFFYSIMKKYVSVETFLSSKYRKETFNIKNIILSNIALKFLHSIKLIHDEGYIHCDIKPENLLIEYTDKYIEGKEDYKNFEKFFDLKINDFGGIKKINDRIKVHTDYFLYSRNYMTAMQYNDLHAFFLSFEYFLTLLNITIDYRYLLYQFDNKYYKNFYDMMYNLKKTNIEYIKEYKITDPINLNKYNTFINKIIEEIKKFKQICIDKI